MDSHCVLNVLKSFVVPKVQILKDMGAVNGQQRGGTLSRPDGTRRMELTHENMLYANHAGAMCELTHLGDATKTEKKCDFYDLLPRPVYAARLTCCHHISLPPPKIRLIWHNLK